LERYKKISMALVGGWHTQIEKWSKYFINQSSTVEAWWIHNLQVPRSKLGFDMMYNLKTCFWKLWYKIIWYEGYFGYYPLWWVWSEAYNDHHNGLEGALKLCCRYSPTEHDLVDDDVASKGLFNITCMVATLGP